MTFTLPAHGWAPLSRVGRCLCNWRRCFVFSLLLFLSLMFKFFVPLMQFLLFTHHLRIFMSEEVLLRALSVREFRVLKILGFCLFVYQVFVKKSRQYLLGEAKLLTEKDICCLSKNFCKIVRFDVLCWLKHLIFGGKIPEVCCCWHLQNYVI